MKTPFRTYLLAGLLLAIPAVLIGCSGGRSSTNFNSTNASLRFSSVSGEGPQTSPLSVRGAITSEEQLQNPNGTLVLRLEGDVQNEITASVSEEITPTPTVTSTPTPIVASAVASLTTNNGITRVIGFGALPFDALDPSGYPSFTITEESQNIISLYAEGELPSESNEGELYGVLFAVSGTIRLIDTSGPFVTYRFENVRFGDSEFGFTVNGTITYDRRNVIDLNGENLPIILNAKKGGATSFKKSGAASAKDGEKTPKTFEGISELFGLKK